MLYETIGARDWLIQEGQAYQGSFLSAKDFIDDGEIVLIYVPSEELVANMLTKATTGAKFKYLRGKLLGLREDEA